VRFSLRDHRGVWLSMLEEPVKAQTTLFNLQSPRPWLGEWSLSMSLPRANTVCSVPELGR
jgi:hypothetical protein